MVPNRKQAGCEGTMSNLTVEQRLEALEGATGLSQVNDPPTIVRSLTPRGTFASCQCHLPSV